MRSICGAIGARMSAAASSSVIGGLLSPRIFDSNKSEPGVGLPSYKYIDAVVDNTYRNVRLCRRDDAVLDRIR